MSNLGDYQRITAISKKVGGPKKLVAIILSGGMAIGVGGTVCYQSIRDKIKNRKCKSNFLKGSLNEIFTVNKTAISNEGLELSIGEKFKILEIDRESALIEVIGNKDNPYFVDVSLLTEISDFPPNN